MRIHGNAALILKDLRKAHVVYMRMGEHDRLDVVDASPDLAQRPVELRTVLGAAGVHDRHSPGILQQVPVDDLGAGPVDHLTTLRQKPTSNPPRGPEAAIAVARKPDPCAGVAARGLGVAGVAIDSAGVRGVTKLPFSTLRSGFPILKSPREQTSGRSHDVS